LYQVKGPGQENIIGRLIHLAGLFNERRK